ncbi:MAG: hypothetical protein KME46_21900 [Brasilonema angustatum HA4187-MV1]|jgi:hypothetical protein|nr:hypothetical protein [Brasilonema angustatum HA4187-MV1]
MNGIENDRKTLERTYQEPMPIGTFFNVVLCCCLGAFGMTLMLRHFNLVSFGQQHSQGLQQCNPSGDLHNH